jgi:hypothetical protein
VVDDALRVLTSGFGRLEVEPLKPLLDLSKKCIKVIVVL